MARTKTLYTQVQLEALIAALEARAAIPKGLSLEQMVQGSTSAIEKMLGAGYSLNDVSEVFHTLEIPASRRSLSYYRKPQPGKPTSPHRAKTRKAAVASPTTARTPTVASLYPEPPPHGFVEMPPLDEL